MLDRPAGGGVARLWRLDCYLQVVRATDEIEVLPAPAPDAFVPVDPEPPAACEAPRRTFPTGIALSIASPPVPAIGDALAVAADMVPVLGADLVEGEHSAQVPRDLVPRLAGLLAEVMRHRQRRRSAQRLGPPIQQVPLEESLHRAVRPRRK